MGLEWGHNCRTEFMEWDLTMIWNEELQWDGMGHKCGINFYKAKRMSYELSQFLSVPLLKSALPYHITCTSINKEHFIIFLKYKNQDLNYMTFDLVPNICVTT